MPGQAVVLVGESQWTVSLATSLTELATGLSGVASIPAGAGILFDVGSDQASISINMSQMLFALDIVFINSSSGVIGVLHDVGPGEDALFDAGNGLGARFFMEVNAGEAADISVGDNVSISGDIQPAFWAALVVAVMAISQMAIVGTTAYRVVREELGKAKEVHSIHGPERDRLVSQYGTWAVGRAESVCPDDDVPCVEREAVRLLAAYKKEAVGRYFYWSILDDETGEIFEQGYPYSTQGRAVWGARAFASKNIDIKHPVTIKIYDTPVPVELEKREEAPVYESKWTRG